jgi:rhodanese-related sulfurtransferase
MTSSISFADLQAALGSPEPPVLIDVRKTPVFLNATDMITGALRREPQLVGRWIKELPRASTVVAYCAHGGEASQGVAKALNESGIKARYLEGGIDEGWKKHDGALDPKPRDASTRWVTRERPKIDRIACPWLVTQFVDKEAVFLYVPPKQVMQAATERDAIPYDVPNVRFTHEGERCSFDAFIKHYRLTDPALQQLALIVRAADTHKFALAPQAPGLAAISLGLSHNFSDDQEMLKHGMVMYDALYAWCREGQDEVHSWNPDARRQPSVGQ